jgi:hypothetical protein
MSGTGPPADSLHKTPNTREVPPGLRPSAGSRLWTPGVSADGWGSGGAGVSMGGDARVGGPALNPNVLHR